MIRDFGSFNRRGLVADLEPPVEMWKGEGWGREHVVYKMDITGTFKKERKEFEGGGLTGVEKIKVLDVGR